MKLIDADELLEVLNSMDWKVTGLGQRMAETQVREMIETAEEIYAVPVSFIEDEINRMTLNVQIAMSEGEDEIAGRWITRQAALTTMIGRWRVKEGKE